MLHSAYFRRLSMDIKKQIIDEMGVQPFQVENTIALLDEGATVPFIARYRKEKTGTLDEIQIRDLAHKYTYYTELDERRASILESIESQGKLTPELKKKIEATISKTELEDLYLPYKPKRMTRGKKATDAGLEPLARLIADFTEKEFDINTKAAEFLNDKAKELGFDDEDKIIKGACDILAEELSDDAEIRKSLRDLAEKRGALGSSVRKDFAEKKTKFNMYYDYKDPVSKAVSHRVLAMLRGEKEKVLRLELEFPMDTALSILTDKLIQHPGSATEDLLYKTAEDALNRLLMTATETEIRKELRLAAEEEAFKVFGENLRNLLLSPPAGRKAVLGLDPGFRTGCKLIAVDNTGKLLDNNTIYPTEPRNDIAGSTKVIMNFISKYGIELIAIGNGTASRETEKVVKGIIKDIPEDKRPACIIVNEAGASVYSASDVAIKEFPDYDLTVRGAVSIARRLQDPLSELVKIDPKAIGVGQYQHDVNQTKLKNNLDEVVESCVNNVGVDLNLASGELLQHVSGLNKRLADSIVNHRNESGEFTSRADLKNVSGLGNKTFEQAAGFLRIGESKNPLDNSAVHPERYDFVEKMASELGVKVKDMLGNKNLLNGIDKNKFVTDEVGLPTIEDIIDELEKPGRDPRDKFQYAEFDDSINDIKDLNTGMKLEGTVTNVTNFGAFVDVGVHQDGLVHISEMSDNFVDDPAKVVKVGQVVKVTVTEVDTELKRIGLSMKSTPGSKPSGGGKRREEPKKKQHTLQDLKNKLDTGRHKHDRKTAKPKFSMKQFMK